MGNVSRTSKAGRDKALLNGIDLHLQGLSQLPLGGKIYTPESLKDFIQQRTLAGNAVDQARAAWLEAIRVYNELDAHADVVVRDLRNLAIGALGADSDHLQTFSFRKPKRATFTQEQMAAIVKKRLETRKARKTMGRRQKAKIKGVVPQVAAAVAAPAPSVAVAGPVMLAAPEATAVPAAPPVASAPAVVEAPAAVAASSVIASATVTASPAVQLALAGAGLPSAPVSGTGVATSATEPSVNPAAPSGQGSRQ